MGFNDDFNTLINDIDADKEERAAPVDPLVVRCPEFIVGSFRVRANGHGTSGWCLNGWADKVHAAGIEEQEFDIVLRPKAT